MAQTMHVVEAGHPRLVLLYPLPFGVVAGLRNHRAAARQTARLVEHPALAAFRTGTSRARPPFAVDAFTTIRSPRSACEGENLIASSRRSPNAA